MYDNLDEVTASYRRCQSSGGFVDTFYEVFLAKSPEIADKFSMTDFERQKLMLRQSLLMMMSLNLELDQAREEIESLGKKHSRHGVDIPPRMYDLWLDSLCEAVQRHDSQYTPELREKWRESMRRGIDLMVSLY